MVYIERPRCPPGTAGVRYILGSLFAPVQAEAGLGAFQQALDILPVAQDDERHGEDGEDHDPGVFHAQDRQDDEEGDHGADHREGHISFDSQGDGDDGEGGEPGPPVDEPESAGEHRHAFAALESVPDGEGVAHHREEGGEGGAHTAAETKQSGEL